MKRITQNYSDGTPFIPNEKIQTLGMNDIAKKIAEYEDAEEQGRLLRLPIDENESVYSIEYCCGEDKTNRTGLCFRGFCESCDKKSYYIKNGIAKQCTLSEIGKSVFFTKGQAEKALAELNN